MITEDYVSFETAKLLKEKGFDEPCDCYINGIFPNTITRYSDYGIKRKNSDKTDVYSAPTLQMAMKWLREKKQIFISIMFCDYPALQKTEWIPEVCTHDSAFDEPSIAYPTYEEACEGAIKYCLENLV